MSRPQAPLPGKLVISALTADRTLLLPVVRELTVRFGALDIISPWWSFDFTRYYQEELGTGLMRRMLSFRGLIDQGALAPAKIATNALEIQFSRQDRRRVNLDPGVLTAERFVLATGKNFAHRIYIGQQIYADLTLLYQRNRFQTLPWTYPDYGSEKMLAYLKQVRDKYGRDLQGD